MKRIIFTPLVAMLALTACDKHAIEAGVPDCVVKSTNELSRFTSCSHGAYVKEYRFQDKVVYVLYPGDCTTETASQVIDSDCKQLGHLGGFTGNTKINGVEFSPQATLIRTIWEQ